MGAAPGGGWALHSRGESCTQASTQGSSGVRGPGFSCGASTALLTCPCPAPLRHQTTSVLQDMVQST